MVINAAELYRPSCRLKFNPMVDLNQSKIVLLEADSSRRDFLKSTFLRWGYLPFVFEKESICLDNLASLNPDLVISGSCTSDDTIRFVNSLKMIRYSLPVLLLADDSILEDYINTSGFTGVRVYRKNTSLNKFRCAVLQALDPKANEGNDGARPLVVGNSPEIAKIKKLIPKLGQSNEAVIIEGEPGTGKEILARAIHGHSNRRNNPFIKVNAVKLPYQLLEGELFGNQNCGAAILPRHKNGILSRCLTKQPFLLRKSVRYQIGCRLKYRSFSKAALIHIIRETEVKKITSISASSPRQPAICPVWSRRACFARTCSID